jgi:hypothetical protein
VGNSDVQYEISLYEISPEKLLLVGAGSAWTDVCNDKILSLLQVADIKSKINEIQTYAIYHFYRKTVLRKSINSLELHEKL